MAELEEYAVDDAVWVKVARMPWWPGIVVDPSKHFDQLTVSRKPLVAMVHFPPFHNFECVRDPKKIHPFNCEKKDWFIKQADRHLQGKDQALYSSEFSQSLDFVKKASADCERSSVIGQCMAMAAPVGTSEEDLEPDTLPDINTACKPAAQGKAARARGLHSARAKPGKAGPAKARVTDTQSCRRRQMATKTAVARTANKPSAEPPEKNRPGDRGQPMGGKMGPVSSRTKPLLSSAWPPGRGCSSEMSGVHPLKTRPSGRKLDIKPGTGKRSLSAERSLSVGSCVKCLRPHATQCNPCSQVSAGPRRRSASGGYVLPVQQWTLQKGSCGQAIKTATQTVQPALSWASVGDGRPPASGCQNYPGNVGVVGSSHEDLVVQPQKPGAIHSSQSPEDQPTTTTPSEAATSTVPYPLELADLSAGDVSLPDIRQPRHSQLRSRKRRKKTCGPQEQRKRKRASKKAVNLSACGVDMASQRPELSAIYGDGNTDPELPSTSSVEPVPSTAAESDEDDDLPDVLGVDNEKAGSELTVGDMVWVKYRAMPHWPALVQTIYKKIKKVTVIFICESPEQACSLRLTMTKKSVVPFSSQYSQFKFFKDEGLNSMYARAFEKSIDRVDSFFISNGLGEKQTAKSFFAEDLLNAKGMQSSSVMGEHLCSTPPPSDTEEDQPASLQELAHQPELQEDREEEDAESPGTLKKIARLEYRHEKRKEKNEALIAFIKTAKCQLHLSQVFLGKVKNSLHDTFLNSPPGKVPIPGFGPVDDDDQLLDLMEVMHKLQRREKPELKLPDTEYFLYVLIPEAIVFALINVRGYRRGRAVEFLAKGAHRTKEESQLLHQQLMRGREQPSEQSVQEDDDE